jgi:AraC family transcriptional regulator of adaptative response/methylated-DNA-[protein]-cysteine methyltransferase
MHATAPALDLTNADGLWAIFQNRDDRYAGRVYLGVRTTGIYCRPKCPARAPKRQNVVFFLTRESAEAAGFRPCKRCKPDQLAPDPRVALVERACRAIEERLPDEIDGDAIAAALGVPTERLQRVFREVSGVSLASHIRGRKMQHLRDGLRQRRDVAFAIYDAGFSSSSRVYEHAGRELGMTPVAYRDGGAGERACVAVERTPFGELLVAWTERGICAVRLGASTEELLADLRREFPAAELADAESERPQIRQLVEHVLKGTALAELPFDVRGTLFQRRVWEELRRIPRGETRTYAEVAAAIGEPGAVRAVANACGANRAALAIPCHRVVRSDGGLGGYRWGVERKRQLLAAEGATIPGRTSAGSEKVTHGSDAPADDLPAPPM